MTILRDSLTADRYDVIVVGAGIGGLTAAALLAKRGVKVLVIEQHYIPGGACTALRRKDITFDAGAAVFFGFGNRGFAPNRFVINELEEDLELIPHDATYRLHLDGHKVSLWRDMDRYLAELIAMFPNQEKEIRSLYKEMNEFYERVMVKQDLPLPPTEIPPVVQLKSFLKDPVGMVQIIRRLSMSLEDVLNKHVTDPRLVAFFDLLMWFFTCTTAKESPAIVANSLFMDTHQGGACYALGSPQMLPNTLEKAIEKNGGQILYRHLVDEILIEKGTAYGVRLKNGTDIMADRVVSNATVWNLYGKLVRSRHIKPKRMAWAQRFIPTCSHFLIYLGVKAEAIPEDARPIELLIKDIYDLTGDNYGIFIPSLDDPTLAPPGTHSMTIFAPSRYETDPHRFGAYQSEEYYRRKQEEAEKVLDDLQEMYFPRLKENILCMEAATPATMERFTLKNFGAIAGPKLNLDQMLTKRLKARSDWKNLYLVGDSTSMGEGVISATASGVGAANMILKDLGLKGYMPRPFERQYVHYVKSRPWAPAPVRGEPMTDAGVRRMAKECHLCEKPGCTQACPAGIDVLNFVRRLEAGNVVGAARHMREMNPLAEICGHLCPSERFCEKACNRLEFSDRSVRIRDLQAWACEQAGHRGWERSQASLHGDRAAVVGSGPAGLSCAYFLARLGYGVDIYEKGTSAGGMLTRALPFFRMPLGVMEREIQGLSLPGISFLFGQELGKDVTLEWLAKKYDATFLAPGLWAGRQVPVKGLMKSSCMDALSFLVNCRGKEQARVKDRVLVIGGGSVATDAAMTALGAGTRKVTLVCLEEEGRMPCMPLEMKEMREKGIEVMNGWGPGEAVSPSSLSLVKCLGTHDEAGRFAPRFDKALRREVEFDQVIMAVGQAVEPDLAKYLEGEFSVKGLLPVDKETLQVQGRAGVYAGGDIVRGAGTVVEAVADGRRAARAMDEAMRQARHFDG